ncbi:uncharacterized protein LOC126828562 [Patella vulgata]|uniref:uncharacterized protein LOC126828562 n=1 Tax=Patella vulgata TaxID=6465 RepID=UPI00217FB17F|nr:uncharacterized protein LOC126828562 [Patella vulgata]XP_050414364.1 uncharacterized protein LOC126828562 [Patella vulgata]
MNQNGDNTAGLVNGQVTNSFVETDSDIVFMGESPGFLSPPPSVAPPPVSLNGQNVNQRQNFQHPNQTYPNNYETINNRTPSKQKHNVPNQSPVPVLQVRNFTPITVPRTLQQPRMNTSPNVKQIPRSPSFRQQGQISPNSSKPFRYINQSPVRNHPVAPVQSVTCRYQITNSPSYKITNRDAPTESPLSPNSDTKLESIKTNTTVSSGYKDPGEIGLIQSAEELWDKMKSGNSNSNESVKIKNEKIANIPNEIIPDLIVIEPDITVEKVKSDDEETETSDEKDPEKSDEKSLNCEADLLKRRSKKRKKQQNTDSEKSDSTGDNNTVLEDGSMHSRENSNDGSIQSSESKKRRGRPKKKHPEIYIENLETGEGSPLSDIVENNITPLSIQSSAFPVPDVDKTDQDYTPGSKKRVRPKFKQTPHIKPGFVEANQNPSDNREALDSAGLKEAIANKRQSNAKDVCNAETSSILEIDKKISDNDTVTTKPLALRIHHKKMSEEKRFKTFKSLSASVRRAKLHSRRTRSTKTITSPEQGNSPLRSGKKVNKRNNVGSAVKRRGRSKQSPKADKEKKPESVSDSLLPEVKIKVPVKADTAVASTSKLEPKYTPKRRERTTSELSISSQEKKSPVDKKKGVVKNIGAVISGLFGDGFMSMADSNGFVVNVRLDVEKKPPSPVHVPVTRKRTIEQKTAESDPACLSTSMFKNRPSDQKEKGPRTGKKYKQAENGDPDFFTNAELCNILKNRISAHPHIDSEMKAAVIDSIQYAKKLLDS